MLLDRNFVLLFHTNMAACLDLSYSCVWRVFKEYYFSWLSLCQQYSAWKPSVQCQRQDAKQHWRTNKTKSLSLALAQVTLSSRWLCSPVFCNCSNLQLLAPFPFSTKAIEARSKLDIWELASCLMNYFRHNRFPVFTLAFGSSTFINVQLLILPG